MRISALQKLDSALREIIRDEIARPQRNQKSGLKQSTISKSDESISQKIGIGFLLEAEKLKEFYNRLEHERKLDCGYDLFSQHIYGGSEGLLPWHGYATELVKLFFYMNTEDIIPYYSNYILTLCAHFCESDGTPFDRDVLKTLRHRPDNRFIEKIKAFLRRLSNS